MPFIDKYSNKATFVYAGPLIFLMLMLLSATLSFVNPLIGIVALFLVLVSASVYALGFFQFAFIGAGGVLVLCAIVAYLYTRG